MMPGKATNNDVIDADGRKLEGLSDLVIDHF